MEFSLSVPGAVAPEPPDPIVFLDADGNRVRDVDFSTYYNATSKMLKVRVKTNVTLALLLNVSWVEARVPDIALENVSFSPYVWASRAWYRIELSPGGTFVDLRPFQPLRDRALFSRGSTSSVRMDRPMFIRLQKVPNQRISWNNGSNANGTWSYRNTVTDGPLVLNLTDRNSTGQTVRLNISWVSALGIGAPTFSLSTGEAIPFETEGGHYVLHPSHFSFIYVFSRDEHFRKETDFPYSNVRWDEINHYIYMLSDRRDTGDEWLSRHLPQEIDTTTDFEIVATWVPSTQGNWQLALPLFLVNSRNVGGGGWNLQASGIYFTYSSRGIGNCEPWCTPWYYLQYYDQAGVARISPAPFEGGILVPYKFFASYSAASRVLTMQIRTTYDAVLYGASYTIGTNPNDGFSFGKIGSGSRSLVRPYEPPSIGTVDDVWLTTGAVPNPSVEVDSNGDLMADGWHPVYLFGSWSNEASHSGTWSIKIDDYSTGDGGGLETDNIPGIPGQYYRAVAYARVQSGAFLLSLRFMDASGLPIAGPTTIVGPTDTYWRRVYADGVAPPGTASVRILAWSSMANVGTAYFDSFYLVVSKLDNAGFEEVVGTTPTHWTGISGTVPTVSSAHVWEGTYSLRLQDSSSSEIRGVRSDAHPCVMGAKYRAAAWLYVESASPGGGDRPYTLFLIFRSLSGAEEAHRVDGGAVASWDYLAVEAIGSPFCGLGGMVLVEFRSSAANVGTAYLDTVELLLAPPGLETDSSIWAVAIHGALGVPDSLTPTSDLGVGHQRWDWLWDASYLGRGIIDWSTMGQRRVYLRTANRIGIDVVIIVGGSLADSTPTWVDGTNFAQEWNAFCRLVGQQFGASAYWYQLANEQNWVWGRWDDVTVFNECFWGLRMGEIGTYDYNYDHTWFFRSIVNAATYGPGDWRGDLRTWLAGAGASIDVVAIDHYPGEWPGGPYDEDWSHLEWLGDFAVLHGKLAAVMETGKSTAWPCDQTCQSNWILNNIRDHVRPIVSDHNTYYWNNRFVLLTWYELWDSGAWPLESLFGLMTRTYSPKTSYATFRSEGLNYVGPPFYS